MTPSQLELTDFILKSQSIYYAVFSQDGVLRSASDGLEHWLSREVAIGQALDDLFPELGGMMTSIKTSIEAQQNVEIDYVALPDQNGKNRYMNILIKPFQADLLLLAIDATGVGKLEQRLMQQRNELALLTNQLEKSRSQLLGMATRFMPGQVFDSLLLDRVPPSISGSRREATIVFADLRGFSQWSQDREPEESFRMVNLFFSQSIRIVQEYNGTLDKFLGDGFMTIFNAPHDQPDHIQRAVNFAEEISRLENDGLRFGVGIHSGVVMSGNIGTDQVMNSTVLGHTVNLAKRIEETAAAGEVLMTETIAQHIRYDHEARFIRSLAWNENQEPVSIYCLVQQSK